MADLVDTERTAELNAAAVDAEVAVADNSGLSELAAEGLAVAVPVDAPPRALAEVLADVARRPYPSLRICRHQTTVSTSSSACGEIPSGPYGEGQALSRFTTLDQRMEYPVGRHHGRRAAGRDTCSTNGERAANGTTISVLVDRR